MLALSALWLSCSQGAIKISGTIEGIEEKIDLKLTPIDAGNSESISAVETEANRNFELTTLVSGDKIVSKQSLLGTYCLMDFWATWCGPCLKEMANLHAMHAKFKDQNFAILSLSIDDSVGIIEKIRAAKWPMPWMHTIIEGGSEGSAYSELGRKFRDGGRLWSVPKPILVSPEGVILATHFSLMGDNLEPTLYKFLNQANTDGKSD